MYSRTSISSRLAAHRKLVARRLGRSEDRSQDMAEQAMAKSDSLLDPAELLMAIEEDLGIQIDGYPKVDLAGGRA